MKKISIFLSIFFFSFSTISYAENVEDFIVEGISVGDSLLNYMTKKEITKIINDPKTESWKDEWYKINSFEALELQQYDEISLLFKRSRKFPIVKIQAYKNHERLKNCLDEAREFIFYMMPKFSEKQRKINYDRGGARFQWSDSGDYAGCGCNKDTNTFHFWFATKEAIQFSK